MPTASDESRALMAKWFGKHNDEYAGLHDGPPMEFLFARGWTEERGMWSKPTPSHNPSIYEVACLLFLRDEWDYDFVKPLYPEI